MIDQSVPAGKEIYLICDNYSTHKHVYMQEIPESVQATINSIHHELKGEQRSLRGVL
jgi:hypothetical protein